MGWGYAVGAAINDVSSLRNGLMNAYLSYDANRKLMQKSQQWQERMSNTAHQREVKDLQKAGLNPILSAMGGEGASTGNSSAGSMTNSWINNSGDAYQYFNAKNQAEQTQADVKLKNAQADMTQQQTQNVMTDTQLKMAQNEIMNIEKQLKTKDLEWYEREHLQNYKKNMQEIINIGTMATVNNAKANELKSQINLNNATNALEVERKNTEKTMQNKNKAEEKYTNEKSRGYGNNIKLGPFSVGIEGNQGISKNNNNNTNQKRRNWKQETDNYGRKYWIYTY